MTADERVRLLSIARRSLEARVRREGAPRPAAEGAIAAYCGAFVSIHTIEDLRGCLGRLERDAPLAHTVHDLAALVADSDPRFEPVRTYELPHLAIEISVLTPEERVGSIADVIVGRHGLIVEQGRRRGLLLPQVASERGWDSRTFVEHTCVKAGLARDAWRHGAGLFVFEAEVFAEAGAINT
jgi:AmmeMemoRadiSam system protein A